MVDPFLPAIRALLLEHPGLKATVVAERVGYNGGVSTSLFRAKVAEVRAQLGVVDPADRLVFAPGEQVQCDLWFPETPVLESGQVHPVLTMLACWSRYLAAVMIPTRQCGDILAGMNILLGRLGGLPRHILWDNESGIVSGRKLIPQASAWAGTLGAGVKLAKPRDPETKGRVERANGYLDSSFEPARQFATIADFNQQLDAWLAERANVRYVRSAQGRPGQLVELERASYKPLPSKLPPAFIETTVRLPRDYYVRVAGCDYSVDPSAIGRVVQVRATLDRVSATLDGRAVADHARCHKPHQTVTDPGHVEAAARLRAQFQRQAAAAAARPAAKLVLVEGRDLASYDRLYNQVVA
jgi:transposase